MAFVLDSSMAMAWCFEDEKTPHTEAVLDRLANSAALVPAIWPLEIANVLLVGERRQRLTEAQSVRFLQLLRKLPIAVDAEALSGSLEAAMALARHHGLSAYDATYLELAIRQGLPLATREDRLRAAAGRIGVALVEDLI